MNSLSLKIQQAQRWLFMDKMRRKFLVDAGGNPVGLWCGRPRTDHVYRHLRGAIEHYPPGRCPLT